jgi:glycosyltransferase involved in cell wall biosynthesis
VSDERTPKGPRITVVTPSFNQGRFLAPCIESILSEDYPNLEYFIVDGGSTDESLRVIERYRDRIAWWVSEPDGGQSDAINKGFRRATGDLVAWLNADDYYLPGALRAVVEAYRANPAASFYFGDGLRVDEEGRPIARFAPEGNDRFDPTALVYGLNYILQPSTFINRAYLERAGYLDVDLKYGMDSDLWMRLAKLAPPVAIPACLSASREYATTKTSSGSFPRAEELRRIGEKHSGLPLTPGALCYYLDTIHRLVRQRPDAYPSSLLADIERFWHAASAQMARYGARPDGFPLRPTRDESSSGLLPATPKEDRPPLVSIVTPSYNQGRFLRRTIDSVLNQTYPYIEYLVMDGGSQDESVEILKSYGDRFCWVSERDGGQTDAINKGLARARGDILAYLNSDDVLRPNAVERAIAHFRRNPACDLLYGKAHYLNEQDEIIGIYATADYSFERLMMDCCICQPAAFWRAAIARKVGPFDDRLNYVMDFDYWLRVDRAGGRIEHVHEWLACSRLYPQTKTLSARREIYREIFQVCQRHGGYVHLNYFYGLWHHLCEESGSVVFRRLKGRAHLQQRMARLHNKWHHRHQYSLGQIAGGLGRRLRRHTLSVLGRLLPRRASPAQREIGPGTQRDAA